MNRRHPKFNIKRRVLSVKSSKQTRFLSQDYMEAIDKKRISKLSINGSFSIFYVRVCVCVTICKQLWVDNQPDLRTIHNIYLENWDVQVLFVTTRRQQRDVTIVLFNYLIV